MNDRIKELARKANMVEVRYSPGFPDIRYPENFEKFAELIVNECIQLLTDEQLGAPKPIAAGMNFGKVLIQEHFGVK